MTADNLAMAAYIAILMSIPAQLPPSLIETNTTDDADGSGSTSGGGLGAVTSESVSLALAAGVLACGLGNMLAAKGGFASGGLAFTALVASGVATFGGFLRSKLHSMQKKGDKSTSSGVIPGFSGAEAIGSALMMMFFCTIGAAAGSLHALRGSGWLLIFIAIQLTLQLGISLALGRFFKISMPVVLIAANANVGGPATAAAMAGAKGWKSLVQPAVLTGALGYAIANGIGWAMGNWLMTWKFI